MATSTSFMGASIRRREDPRLITGSSTYVDDMTLPGLLYMAVLRSTHAHARLVEIDPAEARALDGVYAVYTAADLDGLLLSGGGSENEGAAAAGGGDQEPQRPLLASQKVTHVGEPIAIAVALTPQIAEDALFAINVSYDPLPVVLDPEAALEQGAPLVHDNRKDNATSQIRMSRGEPDTAFAEAEVVVTQRIESPRLAPNPMETRGAVARYERGNGVLTLWTSTQGAHGVRDNLVKLFRLPESRVRVIAPEVGGGFGCKFGLYPEDALAAWAAMQTGQPVKWIERRSEHLLATNHGRGQVAYISLAASRDGKISGMRFKVIGDLGAYGQAFLGSITATMVTGCYDIPHVEAQTVSAYTNKTFLAAYRGAGRPEAAYYVERAIDLLAQEVGLDPAEVRRKNFIAPENFPYKTHGWANFDSGDYVVALDAALRAIDYPALCAERDRLRAEGRVVGVGMASYVEICGFGWDVSTVRVEPGGAVSVYTGVSPHGQGQETTFSQIIADVIGVTPNDVTLTWGDTKMGIGFGTGGSRGTAVGGMAVYKAANEIREKMRQIAGHMLEAAPDDLDLENREWTVRGAPGRAVSVADVARAAHTPTKLPAGMDPGLSTTTSFDPGGTSAPFGTHVVAVEIDRETGVVSVLRYIAVDDCGTILSPVLVDGQVIGGVAQGVSQALYEQVVYDEQGQLITGTLMDYNLPKATQIPAIEMMHTHTPTALNPLGVKGIGEAATVGSTPAIVNAIHDALAPFSVRHLDIPLTSGKLWQALSQA